jgi:hypothetical protein
MINNLIITHLLIGSIALIVIICWAIITLCEYFKENKK